MRTNTNALAAALACLVALLASAAGCAPGATLSGVAGCDTTERASTCLEGPDVVLTEEACRAREGAYLTGVRCPREGRAARVCAFADGTRLYGYAPGVTDEGMRALCADAGGRLEPLGP